MVVEKRIWYHIRAVDQIHPVSGRELPRNWDEMTEEIDFFIINYNRDGIYQFSENPEQVAYDTLTPEKLHKILHVEGQFQTLNFIYDDNFFYWSFTNTFPDQKIIASWKQDMHMKDYRMSDEETQYIWELLAIETRDCLKEFGEGWKLRVTNGISKVDGSDGTWCPSIIAELTNRRVHWDNNGVLWAGKIFISYDILSSFGADFTFHELM